MKPDLYTKAVLTIIAIMLVLTACRQIVVSPPLVQAATKVGNGATFVQLKENGWTNMDTVKEIDALSDGSYFVTFKSGETTQYVTDWGKKAMKNFLNP
jgi:hypothetical protein